MGLFASQCKGKNPSARFPSLRTRGTKWSTGHHSAPSMPRMVRFVITPANSASQFLLTIWIFRKSSRAQETAPSLCSFAVNRFYPKHETRHLLAPFRTARQNSTRGPSSRSTGRTSRAPEDCRCDRSEDTPQASTSADVCDVCVDGSAHFARSSARYNRRFRAAGDHPL